MAFTRQHYEKVADILAAPAQQEEETHQVEHIFDLVQAFANLFEKDNERFDRDKFFDRVYEER